MDNFLDKLAWVIPSFLLLVLILLPICRSSWFIFTTFTHIKLFIYIYLQVKSRKILNIIDFVNTVNFMSVLINPKEQIIDRSTDRGLYVKEDDQDWGSAGMNNVQEDSE